MPCAQWLQRLLRNGFGVNSEQSQIVQGQLHCSGAMASGMVSGAWLVRGRNRAMRSSSKAGAGSATGSSGRCVWRGVVVWCGVVWSGVRNVT